MIDGLRNRNVEDALNRVLSRIPSQDAEALERLWEEGVQFAVVDGLECLGICSGDGRLIGISPKTVALPSRGIQLVLAHELAHALQVATRQVVEDKQAMERDAEKIMDRWGYTDEEIEFWIVYAEAAKEMQRRMKNALMRKDEDLMRTFAEHRREKELVAA
jgi:hypothetical protein